MAELARRGIEYMLSVYGDGPKDWTPPKPRSLGWKGLSESELKEVAQKSLLEVEVSKSGKA